MNDEYTMHILPVASCILQTVAVQNVEMYVFFSSCAVGNNLTHHEHFTILPHSFSSHLKGEGESECDIMSLGFKTMPRELFKKVQFPNL